MARGEITTTVIGNLTDDPELRFTPNGTAVANFTVAVNPRTYNRQTGEWEDGEPSFLRCVAWRNLAEHVAESLTRGNRAVVTGTLSERRWTDKETEQPRSAWELRVEDVGPSLMYATARPRKVRRDTVPPDDEFANASTERPTNQTPAK